MVWCGVVWCSADLNNPVGNDKESQGLNTAKS